MIMWKSIKNFFAVKYRILPVYSENEKCGFSVQEKGLLSQWVNSQVSKIERVKTEHEVLVETEAFFKTEEEAKDYVNRKKSLI